MSVHDDLARVVQENQDSLLKLLGGLEAAAIAAGAAGLPREADMLSRAIWPALKAYGRRTERGVVDEEITPMPKAWRPSPEQQAAFKAGLPIPADDEGSRG